MAVIEMWNIDEENVQRLLEKESGTELYQNIVKVFDNIATIQHGRTIRFNKEPKYWTEKNYEYFYDLIDFYKSDKEEDDPIQYFGFDNLKSEFIKYVEDAFDLPPGLDEAWLAVEQEYAMVWSDDVQEENMLNDEDYFTEGDNDSDEEDYFTGADDDSDDEEN